MNYEIKASVDSLGSGNCLLCNAAFLVSKKKALVIDPPAPAR